MKKEKFCRTDLAVEWQKEPQKELPRGVTYQMKRRYGFSVHRLSVTDPEGAAAIGKGQGEYLTYELGRPWSLSDSDYENAVSLLSAGIAELAACLWAGENGGCEKGGSCPQKAVESVEKCRDFMKNPTKNGKAVEKSDEASNERFRQAPHGDSDGSSLGSSLGASCENLSKSSQKDGCEPPHGKEEGCVLVVGLGNRAMIADAVGPMTVDRITVTRHVESLDHALFEKLSHRSVAAFCPGVLGQTGMESADAVRAVVRTLRPRLLLVIDALAARSSRRLGATVQISTGGIAPGSGVGNDRPAFTRESMGVPVLALGVPMVVDSSTLVADALEQAGVEELPEALWPVLENGRSFFVSLKEADTAAESLAELLALAIDRAMAL